MTVRAEVRETHVLDIPRLGRVTALLSRRLGVVSVELDVPVHPIPGSVFPLYVQWVMSSWGARLLEWKISNPLIVTRQRGKFCFLQKGLKLSQNEGDVL